MPAPGSRSAHRSINAWPGWVDALSSLVMVVIFLLMVFVVAQFYMATALTGRDEALGKLNRQVSELAELLALERKAGGDLRRGVAQLTEELQSPLAVREDISQQLATLQTERDTLSDRVATLSERLAQSGKVARELEDANKVISADKEKIDLQLREIASLQADLQALRQARKTLEGDVATLAALAKSHEGRIGELDRRAEQAEAQLREAQAAQAKTGETLRLTEEERRMLLAELGTLRDRSKELEAKLASEAERTMLAQQEIRQKDIRIDQLLAAASTTEAALDDQRKLTSGSQEQVALLNRQIAALRDQLSSLATALEQSEAKAAEQQVQITNLGQRLNQALASKVEELARYRSEFFGRLREVLGTRQDIRVVGDRFVFQSEVLFPSGSATLEETGKARLAELAHTLLDIAGNIPKEVNWVLRVDGHTDRRPISTMQFPSNWELSTARAMSVARFLIEQGIPQERIAVAGFGEFQPLDPASGEEAYARNRRIEIKLDQR